MRGDESTGDQLTAIRGEDGLRGEETGELMGEKEKDLGEVVR